MKEVCLLLVFFGIVAISSVSGQKQSSKSLKQETSTAAAQSIVTQKAVRETRITHIYKKENFSKVQYCSKSGKVVSSRASWQADCIKSKAGCEKGPASAKAAVLKSRAGSYSPAQRAACSSANAKSAGIKKAQKGKA